MPNWGEHILIANKLLEKSKYNKFDKEDANIFIFGNVLPDVQAGYLVKDISNIVPREINHFEFPKEKRTYDNFLSLYKNKLDNPIAFGYLTHLMADFFWNKKFYFEKCLNENSIAIGYYDLEGKLVKKGKRELRIDKQKDFEAFQYYIYENYEMYLPAYSEKISKKSNEIENINIDNEDVKKVIKYINDCKNTADKQNKELHIYKLDELKNQIDETVDFILDLFKKYELDF